MRLACQLTVHKGGQVVTEMRYKNVWTLTSGEKKEKTHMIVYASGFVLPPFLIYPRQRITESLKGGPTAEIVFHCSNSVSVNTELFLS